MSTSELEHSDQGLHIVVTEPGKKVFDPETMFHLSNVLGSAKLLWDKATFEYRLPNSRMHLVSGDIDPRILEKDRKLDNGAAISLYGPTGSSVSFNGTLSRVEIDSTQGYVKFTHKIEHNAICTLLVNRNGEAVWHLENQSNPQKKI